MCAVLCAAIGASILLAAGGAADAWSYPRNTVSGSGANVGAHTITPSNVAGLSRVWRRGSSFAYAGGVTTSDGRAFYGTGAGWLTRNPDDVVARSLSTGQLLWRTRLRGTTMSTPVESDGLVFVTVSDVPGSDQGRLYALSAQTGHVRWSRGQTGAFADVSVSPVVHDGRVYVLWEDEDGTMSALDESTGATIWRRTGAGGGTLIYAADRLIDPLGNVYSPKDGAYLGAYPSVRADDDRFAVANGMIYEAGSMSDSDGTRFSEAEAYRLSCVPQTITRCGAVWRTQLPAPTAGESSVIAATPQRVLIPTSSWTWDGPGGVVALDAKTGALRWQWTDPTDHTGWQVSVGGTVAYLTTLRASDNGDAHLQAFATAGCGHATCPPLGSWPIGKQGYAVASFPVIQNDTVLIWNDEGDGLWAYRLPSMDQASTG